MSRSSLFGQEDAIEAQGVSGKEEALTKVLVFVRKVAANSEFEDTVEFSVAQHGKGALHALGIVPLAAGSTPEEMNTAAEAIVDVALQDGLDAANGATKYLVTLVGHMGRVVFTLKFNEKGLDAFDEEPDEMGLAGQAMRHAEAFAQEMRLMVTEVREMARDGMQSMRQTNGDLLQDNRAMRATQVESLKIYGELVEAKGVRDLALRRAERDDGHKEKVLGMLGSAVPHVLSRFGITTPQDGPFGEVLSQFLSTLRKDQLDAIGAGQRPDMSNEQQAGLRQLLAFLDAERARIAQTNAMNQAAEQQERGEGPVQ